MKMYCYLYTHNGMKYAEYNCWTCHPDCATPTACKWQRLKQKRAYLQKKYGKTQLVFFFVKKGAKNVLVSTS